MVSFHIKCFEKEVRVVEGGVCMVHIEGENLVMAMNPEVLSKTQSQHLVVQYSQLLFVDISEELDEVLDKIYSQLQVCELHLELDKLITNNT